MSKIISENNQVTVMGEIVSGFSHSQGVFGEGFYMVDVRCKRLSGSYDIIPVMVSEKLADVKTGHPGRLVRVNGQFRSYNRHEGRKNRLVLFLFAREVSFLDEVEDGPGANQAFLDGHICKEPVYRRTPLGREVADLLLAVSWPYGKSDYIPCICWGRNARYAAGFKVGGHCAIWGRVQSREYIKKLDEERAEKRVAYEVSASKVKLAGEGE